MASIARMFHALGLDTGPSIDLNRKDWLNRGICDGRCDYCVQDAEERQELLTYCYELWQKS